MKIMRHHADTNNEPTKEVRQWNGIPLNITTKTGESRFSFSPPMTCDYGCIRGSWGAGLDGKALDVYVISDAPTVFRVVQITPTGAIDEYKYVLGAQNFDEAVETFLKHVPRQLFGAASQYSIGQLQDDMAQQSKVRKDMNELTNFVEQLEELIESDDAYSSNIYVLSFEVADNGDISGRFEDAWNGRIFSYSVQKNRIGYKPALTLDRADSATAAKLFDIFSSGYTSLAIRQDAAKSGKKPRCTAVSYSCGKICLSLKNTCWINSAGQKVKKAGGSVASISQGRIDKLRVLARYLAANGNNKWSKYGGAELLAAKASNLEAKRTNLFERNTIKQSLNKLPVIKLVQEKVLETKNLQELKNKTLSVSTPNEDIYNLKFKKKNASKSQSDIIKLAESVIEYVKNPLSFSKLKSEDKAVFLDEIVVAHGVGYSSDNEEKIKKINAMSESFAKTDLFNGANAAIIRSQGAKKLWDTLPDDEKNNVATELIKIKSPLANKAVNDYKNKYVIELVSAIKKVASNLN